MDQLEHQLAAQRADAGAGRVGMQHDLAEAVPAPGLEPQIVQDQVEELAEAVQRHLQPRRIQQAQAQELERAVAQRAAEDAGHLVVQLHRQFAVERGELFLGHARGRRLQQAVRDPGALRQPRHGGRVGTGQEAVDQ
ncbi:hypothetical protein D3C81_800410 [compost metagenome]